MLFESFHYPVPLVSFLSLLIVLTISIWSYVVPLGLFHLSNIQGVWEEGKVSHRGQLGHCLDGPCNDHRIVARHHPHLGIDPLSDNICNVDYVPLNMIVLNDPCHSL